jgi:hypothetical protein
VLILKLFNISSTTPYSFISRKLILEILDIEFIIPSISDYRSRRPVQDDITAKSIFLVGMIAQTSARAFAWYHYVSNMVISKHQKMYSTVKYPNLITINALDNFVKQYLNKGAVNMMYY